MAFSLDGNTGGNPRSRKLPIRTDWAKLQGLRPFHHRFSDRQDSKTLTSCVYAASKAIWRGYPTRIRTLTKGFKDPCATITPSGKNGLASLGGRRGSTMEKSRSRRRVRAFYTEARVNFPSIIRTRPHGFSSRSSSGRSAAGKFWKQTGRAHRWIAAVPTDVKRSSVVAGYGPP